MSRLIKNIIDRLSSAIALILFSPLILILAILIRVNLGSPIFFTQLRPGKDGKIFTFYKFRTMTDAKDKLGNFLPDSDRIVNVTLPKIVFGLSKSLITTSYFVEIFHQMIPI